MSEYFKGYTQHLRSTLPDDDDPRAVRQMNMIPGLFLMKHLGQEGYVLPACKFINDFRSGVIGGINVEVDQYPQHPLRNYATIEGNAISLHNPEVNPATIKGGVVAINNLMRTDRIKRYFSFDESNLKDLILDGSVKLLGIVGKGEGYGLFLQINRSCILTPESITYKFDLVEKDGQYIDFNCSIL